MKNFLFGLFCIFLLFSKAYSVVILLHGTFASNSEWYKPSGSFFLELEENANLIGHKVVSFTWSGKNSDKARFRAAESLAKLILSYPKREPKILIGHSHGGNVIALASKLLDDPIEKLKASMKDPKQLASELEGIYNDIVDKTPTRSIDLNNQNSFKLWIESCFAIHKEILKFKVDNNFRSIDNEKFLIEKAYFLATPVDQKIYLPNMSVIRNVYHFYSSKDFIQPVFGLYDRAYRGICRIVNFKTFISDSSPSHSHMHDKLVARWILKIPEHLADYKIGGFENFDEKFDGEIHISKDAVKYVCNVNTHLKKELINLVTNLPAGNSISLEL